MNNLNNLAPGENDPLVGNLVLGNNRLAAPVPRPRRKRPEPQLKNNKEELQELQRVVRRMRRCNYVCYFAVTLAVLLGLGSLVLSTYNQIARTTTYQRIGGDSCNSPGASTVYVGVTVGFTTSSGSITYQCMPLNPMYYDKEDSKFSHPRDKVYRGETAKYQTFKATKNDRDAQCALCKIEGRASIEVFPARYQCQEPWIEEYNGYLMSDNICVDFDMATISNTDSPPTNSTPLLRHEVIHSDIGSLYQNNYVLTCVVCSK